MHNSYTTRYNEHALQRAGMSAVHNFEAIPVSDCLWCLTISSLCNTTEAALSSIEAIHAPLRLALKVCSTQHVPTAFFTF